MMSFPSVEHLLPHAHPMVLLDEVVNGDDKGLTAVLTIHEDSRFLVPGFGVPAHVGIEYMAQSCGAFAGIEALHSAAPVRLGYLLGTRNFHASVPWFELGWNLSVSVVVLFREGAMAVFGCEILHRERQIATAQITLYQPNDDPSQQGEYIA
jgi:predicted hotdog family 3-hydroxylacyl-ACP dehydratase